MNKKRFLIFLFSLVGVAAIIVFCLFFFQKPEPVNSLLTADRDEDVREFYYRAVPGLKMAENAGLVRPVDKRLDLPGRDAVLNLDRIWYNSKKWSRRFTWAGNCISLPRSRLKKPFFTGCPPSADRMKRGSCIGAIFTAA